MADLELLNHQIKKCTLCPLHLSRNNAVPGEGNPHAKLFFIGEAPGRNEDLQGRPFVGSAGRVLTQALTNAGIDRADVFITSVNKCRPPNNRKPTYGEITTCSSTYLEKQIEAIDPEYLVLMGKSALEYFFGKDAELRALVGKIHAWKGRKIFVTYHPAATIYNRKLIDVFNQHVKEIVSQVN